MLWSPLGACCKTNIYTYVHPISFYRRCPFTALQHTAKLPISKGTFKMSERFVGESNPCAHSLAISLAVQLDLQLPAATDPTGNVQTPVCKFHSVFQIQQLIIVIICILYWEHTHQGHDLVFVRHERGTSKLLPLLMLLLPL